MFKELYAIIEIVNKQLTRLIMTENNQKVKAEIATVKLGYLEFEGLLLPDGSFAIAVPQICSLFSISMKHGQRDIKALLGKDCSISKFKTTLHSGYVNTISLTDFERLVLRLAIKQNPIAIGISEQLIGLSLQQLFCDAFDIEFNKLDRLEWAKARQEGKSVRRTLTDAIKDYLETTETTEEYRKWVYANATELVNLGVFRGRANQLRKDWGCKNPRDEMTSDELRWVLQVEELAMRLIDRDKIEPLNAVREAVSRLCIEVVRR